LFQLIDGITRIGSVDQHPRREVPQFRLLLIQAVSIYGLNGKVLTAISPDTCWCLDPGFSCLGPPSKGVTDLGGRLRAILKLCRMRSHDIRALISAGRTGEVFCRGVGGLKKSASITDVPAVPTEKHHSLVPLPLSHAKTSKERLSTPRSRGGSNDSARCTLSSFHRARSACSGSLSPLSDLLSVMDPFRPSDPRRGCSPYHSPSTRYVSSSSLVL